MCCGSELVSVVLRPASLSHTQVAQACLQCLSEVLSLVGAHLIPLLSGIVPTVLQFVGTAVDRWGCDVWGVMWGCDVWWCDVWEWDVGV